LTNSLTIAHTALVTLITALYWVQLRSFFNPLSFLTRSLIWFSGVAQTLRLADQWVVYGHFPLSNLVESLQWLSWALTVAIGLTQLDLPGLTRRKDRLLGAWVVRQPSHRQAQYLNKEAMDLPKFNPAYPPRSPRHASVYDDLFGALLMPVVSAINLFVIALPDRFKTPSNLVPALQSNWLQMHVVVMISAYACLLIGCLYAIAYLVLSYGYLRNDEIMLGWRIEKADPASLDPDGRVGDRGDPMAYHKDLNENRNAERWTNHRSSSGVSLLNNDDDAMHCNAHSVDRVLYGAKGLVTDAGASVALASTPALRSTLRGSAQPYARPRIDVNRVDSTDVTVALAAARQAHLQRLARSWDNQSYRCIGLGFPLLTMGLLSGAVWANQTWGSYWSWDPKETWALITWFNFAIYLHTRLSRGWSGTRSAGLALIGFVTLWICYLGVNLMAKGLHSYGFFS
jgi:ABC-type transport system involved in cytochrome c biogenesis permease subunit